MEDSNKSRSEKDVKRMTNELRSFERKLRKEMAELSKETATLEDVTRIRKSLMDYHHLVGVTEDQPVEYFRSFQETEEHKHFDRIRTHLNHQKEPYRKWKKERNKEYYSEKLKKERSSPKGRAKLAAVRRQSRALKKYETLIQQLRDALIRQVDPQWIDSLWLLTGEAYERLRKERHPDFLDSFQEARVGIEEHLNSVVSKVVALRPEGPPRAHLKLV